MNGSGGEDHCFTGTKHLLAVGKGTGHHSYRTSITYENAHDSLAVENFGSRFHGHGDI